MELHSKKLLGLTLNLSLTAVLFSSCTCERTESTARALPATREAGFNATDQIELEDIKDFYARTFGSDLYTTSWSEIERYRTGSAISQRIPYLDSWYPEVSGGTDVGNALKRYDQAFHNSEAKAAKWEVEQHGNTTISWYGHCNGTSVASIRYQNPRSSVLRPAGCTLGSAACTEFTPADIRALLSEMNMNAIAKFISGDRCRLTRAQLDQRPALRSNPLVMDTCDDVNPGSFHVGLVNFLGRMKQPLVFDYNQDEEVWNYPIHSYSYDASGPLTEAQAIAAVALPIETWVFNPKAVSWYRVNMTINYRTSTTDLTGSGSIPPTMDAKVYSYILELDDRQQVIGGEWIGASRNDHPDFLWMPFEPSSPTGDKGNGNPFLSNGEVTKIWAESVGLDPKNPYFDKPNNPFDLRFYPSYNDLAWGQATGYYQLRLDGRTLGTAFLGKKTHLRIEVTDVLKTDATLEVLLNGQSISAGAPQAGKLDVLFDPLPGINFLSLRWNSSRVEGGELNRDFRFYAM